MEQDVETIHFHEGKLKVYPQVVKSHSQALQKRSVINTRPHGFHFLLWIDLLLQYLDGILKRIVFLNITCNLLGSVNDGGVVPSSKVTSDGLERGIRHIPAKVHDNLSGKYDLGISLFALKLRDRNIKMF